MRLPKPRPRGKVQASMVESDRAQTAARALADLYALVTVAEAGKRHLGLALTTPGHYKLKRVAAKHLAELAKTAMPLERAVVGVLWDLDPSIARAARVSASLSRQIAAHGNTPMP
jgi:hypothetical protein